MKHASYVTTTTAPRCSSFPVSFLQIPRFLFSLAMESDFQFRSPSHLLLLPLAWCRCWLGEGDAALSAGFHQLSFPSFSISQKGTPVSSLSLWRRNTMGESEHELLDGGRTTRKGLRRVSYSGGAKLLPISPYLPDTKFQWLQFSHIALSYQNVMHGWGKPRQCVAFSVLERERGVFVILQLISLASLSGKNDMENRWRNYVVN